MPEIDFTIRAALSDDMNEGWVWIQTPDSQSLDSQLESRCVVKISRRFPRRFVYVEVRKMDRNFRDKYNDKPRTPICRERDTLVMAEWYRDALGITRTTHKDNKIGTVRLIVKFCNSPIWPSIRAACHHPDISVRLGTRLGLCGVWLGLFGAYLGLQSVHAIDCLPAANMVLGGVAAILAIAALLASRGPIRSTG